MTKLHGMKKLHCVRMRLAPKPARIADIHRPVVDEKAGTITVPCGDAYLHKKNGETAVRFIRTGVPGLLITPLILGPVEKPVVSDIDSRCKLTHEFSGFCCPGTFNSVDQARKVAAAYGALADFTLDGDRLLAAIAVVTKRCPELMSWMRELRKTELERGDFA